jgi:hypothetical protein
MPQACAASGTQFWVDLGASGGSNATEPTQYLPANNKNIPDVIIDTRQRGVYFSTHSTGCIDPSKKGKSMGASAGSCTSTKNDLRFHAALSSLVGRAAVDRRSCVRG